MMKVSAIACLLALTACANASDQYGSRSCGLIGCVSSPYLKAKFSPDIIGAPVASAIAAAGAPDSTYTDPSSGISYLTWRRTQQDGGGVLSCQEVLTVKDSIVRNYRYDGHC